MARRHFSRRGRHFYFSAVRETSIVDVSVIGAFQPALVLLAARRMFSERLGRWDVILITLAMGGVSIAVLGPGAAGHHRVLGDLLAVGSLISFSAYWLVAKRARERTAAMEYTAGVMIMAALATTVVILISGQSLGRIHATDWIWIGLLALVPGSGHFLMNWAHRFVDASISAAISCLSPLVASIVAIPILGQALSGGAGGRGDHRARGDRGRGGAQSTARRTARGVEETTIKRL